MNVEAVTGISVYALTVTDVTTPKVLPPPPRRAQNSSSFSLNDAVTNLPSGVTISMDKTWSAAMP